MDRVPVCGPLLPRIRHLDPVCVCGLHPCSGPGRFGQQPSHRGRMQPFHSWMIWFRVCLTRALRLITPFLLQVNVGHPSEVDEIFDAISYSKGASVIRMLHNYIGDEVGGRPFSSSCVFPSCFTSLFVFCRTSGKE